MVLTDEDRRWISEQLERVETRVLAEIYRSRSRSAILAMDVIEILIDPAGRDRSGKGLTSKVGTRDRPRGRAHS
jgi:hypothetical protein